MNQKDSYRFFIFSIEREKKNFNIHQNFVGDTIGHLYHSISCNFMEKYLRAKNNVVTFCYALLEVYVNVKMKFSENTNYQMNREKFSFYVSLEECCFNSTNMICLIRFAVKINEIFKYWFISWKAFEIWPDWCVVNVNISKFNPLNRYNI